MFGRRRRADGGQQQADASADERLEEAVEPEAEVGDAADLEPTGRYPTPPAARPNGPWDASEATEPDEARIDLGGLRVPGAEGMELRVEVAEDQIIAVTIILGQSAIQLQPFAAPRSEGIWREVRGEIAAGITQQGGIVDEVDDAPLGAELRAQVPVELPDGQRGVQAVRFVGCDGPRWFLRGVISGQAAVQPDAGAALEALFRDVVVVRGGAPMAPRDPIPLRLPEDARMVGANGAEAQSEQQPEEGGRYSADGLNPFERGPEITEVR